MERKNIELLKRQVLQVTKNLLSKIVFAFVLFTGLELFAYDKLIYNDTTSIEGYVCDSINGTPLQYAEIIIDNTQYKTITDSSGYFIIPNIPVANYNLIVKFIGYYDYHEGICLQKNKNFVKIYLINCVSDNESSDNILEIKTLPLGYGRDNEE